MVFYRHAIHFSVIHLAATTFLLYVYCETGYYGSSGSTVQTVQECSGTARRISRASRKGKGRHILLTVAQFTELSMLHVVPMLVV